MKTDIIHLEAFDDIDSIRDRLEWSKADRMVLVWPRRGAINISQLDMALLVRKAAHLGRQIAIVNGGEEIRRVAAAAGIPVFQSQASATLARWPRLPEAVVEPPAQSSLRDMREQIERLREAAQAPPPARMVSFVAGVAAVFALILFFLPGATVHIFPAEIPQTIRFNIQANPDVRRADLAGFIPLHTLESLQSYTERIESSGQAPVSDQFARGRVRLVNRTDRIIAVPQGSVVATLTDPPVRFRVLSGVDIPVGGKGIEVDIEAVQPGSTGNVGEAEIQSMEGPLGLDVAVMNDEATSGGGESLLRSPSEDDILTLREKIKSHLLAQGREAFLQGRKPGQELLFESLQIEKIIDEDISTPAGQPADTLEISLTGEIRMNYVLEEDIRQACREAMDASLPTGYAPADEEIILAKPGEPRFDRGASSMTWEVSAVRRLRSTYSQAAVVRAVSGQPVDRAAGLLLELVEQREKPRIEMRPSWWPALPFLTFRIHVEEG